jgi:DNA-directed RNA polymerase specialized sigma subunit
VVAYSPLATFVAGRTGARLPPHVDQADLISYGMTGLIEAERLGIAENELQEALLQISHASILALEELWMTPDASGDKVSLLDTIEDESATDPQAAPAALQGCAAAPVAAEIRGLKRP